MCFVKFLSYCYNNYRENIDYIYNRDNSHHTTFSSFINGDKKEDKWIRFKKIEGNCKECLKYSPLLAIDELKNKICYKCYKNQKK